MPESRPRPSPSQLRANLAALPTLPPLVTDLIASFQRDDLDIPTLARRISADQGLVARTLRVANSPFYGLARQVCSLDEAIMIVGFRAVRSLVLGAAVVGAFPRQACCGFDGGAFWQHSIAVAVGARVLATRLGRNVDTVFTGGLLHDIGKYVLALCFPEHYQDAIEWQRQHGVPMLDAELAVLGIGHPEAGAELARLWGLPEALVTDIAFHHAPREVPAADIVHLADVLAHALETGHAPRPPVPPLEAAAWARLPLSDEQLLQVLGQIERDYELVSTALLA